MLSKTCEYALKTMIFLSSQAREGEVLSKLDDIAMAIDSPQAFTAKILQQLVNADLVESFRGRYGGFALPKDLEASIADVIIAIDGDKLIHGCMLGFQSCSDEHPCVLHNEVKPARDQLKRMLTTTSIHTVMADFLDNKSHLLDLKTTSQAN